MAPKKLARKDVPDKARDIIQFYSATMMVPDKPVVRKGKFEHLEPGIDPSIGWWVDCKVFVPEDIGD
jgi:hypothetical protein